MTETTNQIQERILMASQEISKQNGEVAQTITDSIYESLALRGDISALTPKQKVAYYRQFCERLGLDPMGQPFLPLKLSGKEVLYATRAATDQLARIHSVSREVVTREQISDVYVVKVRASMPNGRAEESIGAVNIGGMKGEALANCLMRGETKAKRRATLSILGLGLLDETEVESISPQNFEHIQPYAIEAQQVDNAKAPETPFELPGDVEPGPDEPTEHQQLQARLLQEIQQLRDLGQAYGGIQAQMELVTGCKRRDELSSEQLEKCIAAFGEWAQELAEKIKAGTVN
jgi:hypothetical protein